MEVKIVKKILVTHREQQNIMNIIGELLQLEGNTGDEELDECISNARTALEELTEYMDCY